MKKNLQLEPSLVRKCTALISVLVLALTVSVELAHAHPDALRGSRSTESHCSICAVGHSPALAAHAGYSAVPIRSQSVATISAPQWKNRLDIGTSSIRPPPVL